MGSERVNADKAGTSNNIVGMVKRRAMTASTDIVPKWHWESTKDAHGVAQRPYKLLNRQTGLCAGSCVTANSHLISNAAYPPFGPSYPSHREQWTGFNLRRSSISNGDSAYRTTSSQNGESGSFDIRTKTSRIIWGRLQYTFVRTTFSRCPFALSLSLALRF